MSCEQFQSITVSENISQEGYVPVSGGRVWYRIVGSGSAIPLLTLHGGPAMPHDYLEPLAALADERPVIFYDQLGCGQSDRPDDVSLWRLPRFVEELSQVRQALQLERVHLYGHSWGTMLATEYALTQPSGLLSLILASPSMSAPRVREDVKRLCAELPTDMQAAIEHHEAAGTTDAEAYQLAVQEFMGRHLCRLDPVPDALQRAVAGRGKQVSATLGGASPGIGPTGGELGAFDRSTRLHELTWPTLLTCGRYDDSTPAATAWYQSLIPGSEMAVFEHSSHMHHLEEPEHYCQVVRDFLHRVEHQKVN